MHKQVIGLTYNNIEVILENVHKLYNIYVRFYKPSVVI